MHIAQKWCSFPHFHWEVVARFFLLDEQCCKLKNDMGFGPPSFLLVFTHAFKPNLSPRLNRAPRSGFVVLSITVKPFYIYVLRTSRFPCSKNISETTFSWALLHKRSLQNPFRFQPFACKVSNFKGTIHFQFHK